MCLHEAQNLLTTRRGANDNQEEKQNKTKQQKKWIYGKVLNKAQVAKTMCSIFAYEPAHMLCEFLNIFQQMPFKTFTRGKQTMSPRRSWYIQSLLLLSFSSSQPQPSVTARAAPPAPPSAQPLEGSHTVFSNSDATSYRGTHSPGKSACISWCLVPPEPSWAILGVPHCYSRQITGVHFRGGVRRWNYLCFQTSFFSSR